MKPIIIKKTIQKGTCSVRGCKNKCTGQMCNVCRSRKSRLADPIKYSFNNLKNRAKQRGVLFTITLEQFREWCIKVEYIEFKGRSAHSYTIDRIHNDLGYHIDNIQVMTKRDNVRKYFQYDWRSKKAVVIEAEETAVSDKDIPFPMNF